jgi:hypothetical protein
VSGRRAAAQHAAPPSTVPRSNGPALHHDPLAEEQILERFYRPETAITPAKAKPPKPTHYKIVCISLYTDDIERLERMVETLKGRGHTKANKSQLIRAALDQVDLDKVPRSH